MADLIDRQAAIDALEKVAELFPWRVPGKSDTYDSYNEAWNDAIGRTEMEIESLPSAQPEITVDGYADGFADGYKRGLTDAQSETANIIVGKSRNGMTMWYQCDNCNEPVDENDLYCRGCGRRFEHGSDR